MGSDWTYKVCYFLLRLFFFIIISLMIAIEVSFISNWKSVDFSSIITRRKIEKKQKYNFVRFVRNECDWFVSYRNKNFHQIFFVRQLFMKFARIQEFQVYYSINNFEIARSLRRQRRSSKRRNKFSETVESKMWNLSYMCFISPMMIS